MMKIPKKQKPKKHLLNKRFSDIILFLFLFFLPTQFGKHFFLSFSYLSGVRVDYLAPTIYLTDILALLLISINFITVIKFMKNKIVLSVLSLLLLNVFFALSKEIAVYRFIKILELFAIFAVFKKIEIPSKLISFGFFSAVIFQIILIVLQFISKGSRQGIFYFFGERYLALSMPDIAKASIGGLEFLRPYGTFSHPNSMAGFFLLLYSFFLFYKKSGYIALLFIIPILFSFSKVAILGLLIVTILFILKSWKREFCKLCIFSRALILLVLSAIFARAQTDPLSLTKRQILIQNSLTIIQKNPIFGVGLGNYLIAQSKLPMRFLYYSQQPVHNIFFLIFAEYGLFIGGIIFYLLLKFFLNNYRSFSFLAITFSFILTGFFDHYWITLQQNWLILGVVFGLITNSRLLALSLD